MIRGGVGLGILEVGSRNRSGEDQGGISHLFGWMTARIWLEIPICGEALRTLCGAWPTAVGEVLNHPLQDPGIAVSSRMGVAGRRNGWVFFKTNVVVLIIVAGNCSTKGTSLTSPRRDKIYPCPRLILS